MTTAAWHLYVGGSLLVGLSGMVVFLEYTPTRRPIWILAAGFLVAATGCIVGLFGGAA